MAQTAAYRAPRADGGHPDLNGIWQTMNEADYDLEAHVARPAMALRQGPYGPVPAAPVLALGAVGAVPPSLGVVEGGEIPYKSGDARQEEREPGKLADPRSRDQMLSAGSSARHLHSTAVQIFQNAKQIFIAYQFAGAVRNIFLKDPGPAPVDSWMGQSVGTGKARPWSST